jgi:hypothetical protein
MIALGSMAGALRSASRPNSRLRSIVLAAGIFGTAEAITSLAPDPVSFALLLVVVGAAALTFLTAANSTVQMTADDALRGRVMSVYLLVLIGGMPIGSPLVGLVAEHFGVRAAMMMCGLVPAVAAAIVGIVIAHRSGLRAQARLAALWAGRTG